MLHFHVFGGKRTYPGSTQVDPDEEDAKKTEVHLALLDDEYFSFPEVSQVWNELNCSDVIKASKRQWRLDWTKVKSTDGELIQSTLVERFRPRWWYIALTSCSDFQTELSYSMHLENRMRGYQSEFSMDAMNVFGLTLVVCVLFVGLAWVQFKSFRMWREMSRTGRWLSVHPALILLTASTVLASAGEAAWFQYYCHFLRSGEALETWAIIGRAGIVSAKTLMSLLLMLFAQGECVCSPDVAWYSHRELVFGMALFGFLSFLLEVWGDSELRNTATEYIYDTSYGMVLVAFDVLWLWMFASRAWQTFQSETRLKPRLFFKKYGVLFCGWFAALPVIALLAKVLAAHVRFGITLMLSSLVHVAVLALLVHSFQPDNATKLYELKITEYQAVHHDSELDPILGGVHDDEL